MFVCTEALFQDQGHFPRLSRPENYTLEIPGLPMERCSNVKDGGCPLFKNTDLEIAISL